MIHLLFQVEWTFWCISSTRWHHERRRTRSHSIANEAFCCVVRRPLRRCRRLVHLNGGQWRTQTNWRRRPPRLLPEESLSKGYCGSLKSCFYYKSWLLKTSMPAQRHWTFNKVRERLCTHWLNWFNVEQCGSFINNGDLGCLLLIFSRF